MGDSKRTAPAFLALATLAAAGLLAWSAMNAPERSQAAQARPSPSDDQSPIDGNSIDGNSIDGNSIDGNSGKAVLVGVGEVEAARPRLSPAMTAESAGQRTVAEIVASPVPFTIQGHIKDSDGLPVAGATVCLAVRLHWGGAFQDAVFHDEVLSDAEGAYAVDASAIRSLTELPPSRQSWLKVEAHSVQHSRKSRSQVLRADEESVQAVDLELRPVRGRSVYGRLCSEAGTPLEDVEIYYRAPRIPVVAKTGLGGWFVVSKLPEDGELKLHAKSALGGILDETFDLAFMAPHESLGVLTCHPSGVLAGTVVGLGGFGLEGESVLAAEHGGRASKTTKVATGPGGSFRFECLDPDAEYRLSTSKTSPSSILFRPSRSDVTLEIPVYGCSVVLVDADGKPLPSATCRASPSRSFASGPTEQVFPKGLRTTRIGPGRFAVRSETPAKLSILGRAETLNIQWRSQVELDLGTSEAERIVVLEPERSVVLEVSWPDPQGRPLRGWSAVARDLRPDSRDLRVNLRSDHFRLPPAKFEIKFTPPEDRPYLATHREIVTVPDVPKLDVTLPNATLGGQVSMQCRGAPELGDFVAFVVPRGIRSIKNPLSAVLGGMEKMKNVKLRVASLPPGPYDVIVLMDGDTDEPPFKRIHEVTVEVGQTVTVEFDK